MTTGIAIIGECMLELSREHGHAESDSPIGMNLSYGGDTLNAAIYMSRLGVPVNYVTALGDDPMSAWMVGQWQQEGINCELVDCRQGEVPGLYLIETDDTGERSFFYWRDRAPIKGLLDDPASATRLFTELSGCNYLYLSGITLAVLHDESRERLLEWLPEYRAGGGKVIFDGNYRPRLWRDPQHTRRIYEAVYQLTDIGLPTLEDEQALFGDSGAESVLERLRSAGIDEIVLKMGERGCLVATADNEEHVATRPVTVVDTTSAGDSFNAAYLASRLQGAKAPEAALAGHQLASVVIQHRGAIIPLSAMPATER